MVERVAIIVGVPEFWKRKVIAELLAAYSNLRFLVLFSETQPLNGRGSNSPLKFGGVAHRLGDDYTLCKIAERENAELATDAEVEDQIRRFRAEVVLMLQKEQWAADSEGTATLLELVLEPRVESNGRSTKARVSVNARRGTPGDRLIAERTFEHPSHATSRSVALMLHEAAVSLCIEAVSVATGSQPASSSATAVVLQTVEYKAMQRSEPMLRGISKQLFFWTYRNVVRPVPRSLLAVTNRQRIVIILYHRVNDDLRDSLTVGIEQFDRQMGLISTHYPTTDITDLLAGNVPRNSDRPVVIITFDDGYLDNYTNAVPVLLRHGVPAAFFVTTGCIDGRNELEHDRKKLGYSLPIMNWDHLRHMRKLGFTIGSHTVSHINCARETEAVVRRELSESYARLQKELGLEEQIFAYPFGRRDAINDQVVDMVKQTGYVGCLSAYGGCITDAVDPYNVVRVGIDHNFSDEAFMARLEGFGR